MARPPVYEDGLFELSIDPSLNSLDNTFNLKFLWEDRKQLSQKKIQLGKVKDDF
jgi:hypothetical protein